MTTEKKKQIYNRVTGHYYNVRDKSSKYRTDEVHGLWYDKRKLPVRRG